jgi:uncharacterized protein YeaO (DUF488 family)
MSLKTKCILSPIEENDGYRISIMNRHTLNDGVTRDSRINNKMFNENQILLSPSSKLIGDYYKRGLVWDEYKKRFLEEMNNPESVKIIKEISEKALTKNITLLCIEEKPDFCHRKLVAELCKKYYPELNIEIK